MLIDLCVKHWFKLIFRRISCKPFKIKKEYNARQFLILNIWNQSNNRSHEIVNLFYHPIFDTRMFFLYLESPGKVMNLVSFYKQLKYHQYILNIFQNYSNYKILQRNHDYSIDWIQNYNVKWKIDWCSKKY